MAAPVQVTTEAILAAENAVLTQENARLRRSLAEHIAAYEAVTRDADGKGPGDALPE